MNRQPSLMILHSHCSRKIQGFRTGFLRSKAPFLFDPFLNKDTAPRCRCESSLVPCRAPPVSKSDRRGTGFLPEMSPAKHGQVWVQKKVPNGNISCHLLVGSKGRNFPPTPPPPPRPVPVPLLGSAPAVLPGLGVWWPQLWGCGDTYWAPLALHAQQASPQAVNCSKFSPSRQMIHLDA